MSLESGTLLVVDDNEMNRDMLSRRLTRKGHTVDVAEDGVQALAMIEETDYDVVLLDIMMPGIDGYQTLERIRADRDSGDLPVIMATAKDASEDVVAALKLGANDYVTKPFDFPVVLARVTTQLQLRRSRQDLARAHRRMKKDLEAAARIQAAFLPSDELVEAADGLRCAWRYVPCDELAGDTLGIVPLSETKVGVYVVDVSGHGVPSALLSVSLSRLFGAEPASSVLWTADAGAGGARIASPVEVLDELCRRFPYDEQTGQYFTLVYAVIDLERREMSYASAGHEPLIVIRPDGSFELGSSTGRPVALVPAFLADSVNEERSIALGSGDRIYFYSDGIPEAQNDGGEEFDKERLTSALAELKDRDLDTGLPELLEMVRSWQGGPDFIDDVSIVGVEIA
ncbi:MAG: SpoIIE family protein phosphatase [Thermoanaerobaculales bacterium]|jgi:sigma-B regulation protein RsbU (phosphoserine phosphatase)|nr:SpoIIE family protein phosphatase [Thermoanaerobaculales bacterium]